LHDANSYTAQGVTVDSITKQLEFSRALWKEQYRFLFELNPEIARQLSVPENSPYIALLQYLQAKLCNRPSARKFQQEYLTVRARNGETKLSLFWRLSIYLPNFFFRPAIDLLLGHGAVKQFIARLRKLV
jgi:hypothetical protein